MRNDREHRGRRGRCCRARIGVARSAEAHVPVFQNARRADQNDVPPNAGSPTVS
jgi:hypothetical protein